MAKATRKITGFLWAMLIAVISFFIIYIFLPDVSTKFFGVSLKEPKNVGANVQSAVESTAQTVMDKTTEVVSDAVSGMVETVINNTLTNK